MAHWGSESSLKAGRRSGTKLCLFDHSLPNQGKSFAQPSVAAAILTRYFGLNTGIELAHALIPGTEIGPDRYLLGTNICEVSFG